MNELAYGSITISDLNTIVEVKNYYLATSASTGVTKSTSGWTTTIQTMDSTKQYLWNYEENINSAGEVVSSSSPVIIGRYGQDGAVGRGISSITEYYYASNSTATPADNLFKTTVQTTSTTKPYLWNYEKITYTDNNTESTAKRIIGVYGETGVSVAEVKILYYLKSNTTAPNKPTSEITSASTGSGVWTTAVPTYIKNYSYFTCAQTKLSDGTFYWSDPTLDQGLTTANANAAAAASDAAGAIDAANNAIKSTVSCYYRSTTLLSTPNDIKPTTNTSIGTSATTSNAWQYVMPQPKKDEYFYTCEKYIYVNNSISFSDVREIATATYASKWVSSADNVFIDGGALYANSVTADQINTSTLTVSSLGDGDDYSTTDEMNTAMSGAIISETTLYYVSNSTTPPNKPTEHVTTNNANTRGQWNITLPTYNASYPYLYICTETKTKGGSYAWTSVEQTTYASAINAIKSTADAAAPKSSAVARTQRIYWRATSASGKPNKNTTWLSTSGTGYGNWSLSIPQLTSGTTKYPYLYTAVQSQTVAQQAAGTTCTCSDVLLDDSTTVIDGGKIITGSVSANSINADSGTFNMANIPNLTAEKIKTNVIEAINDDSNEGITISAKRVNIEGATIFSSGRLSTTSLDNAYDAKNAASNAVTALTNDLASASGTTVINGGHITTGTIDASKATITNIDGSKITAGTISAGAINADSGTFDVANIPTLTANKINTSTITVGSLSDGNNYSTTEAMNQAINGAISDIEIGGRNLLLDSNAPSLTKVASVANRYWSSSSTLANEGTANIIAISNSPMKGIEYGIELNCTTAGTVAHGLAFYSDPAEAKLTFEKGKTYTISSYARVVSGTAETCQINIQNASTAGISSYKFTPTTDWVRYEQTITPTATLTNKVVYFEYSYSSVAKIQMCGFKVEEGNKATSWTPAPEDVDVNIDDAAKTATNYIEADSTGIKIHSSSDSTDYLHINSNNITFYRNNVNMAAMTDSQLRIGQSSKAHVQVSETGITLYGYDTSLHNLIAISGNNGSPSVRIGELSLDKYNTLIDSGGMKVRKGSTILASYGDNIVLGESNNYNTKITSSSIQMCDGSTVLGEFSGNNITLGITERDTWGDGDCYIDFSNNGFSIKYGDDATSLFTIGYDWSHSPTPVMIADNDYKIKITNHYPIGNFVTLNTQTDEFLYGTNIMVKNVGGKYMQDGQNVTLDFNISSQPHGVVLVWSAFISGATQDYDWIEYFIPKSHVILHNGTGIAIPLCTTDATTSSDGTGNGTKWGCKYLRIYDNEIRGYKGNNKGNSAYWVLRYVIGV